MNVHSTKKLRCPENCHGGQEKGLTCHEDHKDWVLGIKDSLQHRTLLMHTHREMISDMLAI